MRSMPPLRTLIVDDEALARRGIRARLAALEGVLVVGECGDGRDAVEAIRRLEPDLVLLDVQMPGRSGFDVIEEIGADRMPALVFVTAFDAHAIRAFDVQALDYVLKPIESDRLIRAVDRARRRVAERREGMIAGWMSAATPNGVRGTRLVVRDRGRIVLLQVDDVTRIEADGDYVRVYAGGVIYLVRETMAAMDARLDRTRFMRVHRSTIVHVGHVRELQPRPNAEYVIVLDDGVTVRASRGYSQRLQALIDPPHREAPTQRL